MTTSSPIPTPSPDFRDEVDTLALLNGWHVERDVPLGPADMVLDEAAGLLAFGPDLSGDDELLLLLRALDADERMAS